MSKNFMTHAEWEKNQNPGEMLGFLEGRASERKLILFGAACCQLRQELTDIKVYKVGDDAEKQAFACGKTSAGQWAGLKTTVVET